jgi:hypothetical protein
MEEALKIVAEELSFLPNVSSKIDICEVCQVSCCANVLQPSKIVYFRISYFNNFCPMIQKNAVHLVHVFRWRVGRIRRTVKNFPKSFINSFSFNFHPRNIHQKHKIFCVARSKNFIVPLKLNQK